MIRILASSQMSRLLARRTTRLREAEAVVRPILIVLTFPLTIITLGLFLLVINALMLMLVSALVKGFKVNGFWTALFASLFIAILSIVLNAILYPGPTFTFTAPHGTQV